MTTLEQLLDNFRHAVLNAEHPEYDYRVEYVATTQGDVKAAQDAIVAHVEGAMIASMVHGKASAKSANMGEAWEKSRADAWDELVGRWTK